MAHKLRISLHSRRDAGAIINLCSLQIHFKSGKMKQFSNQSGHCGITPDERIWLNDSCRFAQSPRSDWVQTEPLPSERRKATFDPFINCTDARTIAPLECVTRDIDIRCIMLPDSLLSHRVNDMRKTVIFSILNKCDSIRLAIIYEILSRRVRTNGHQDEVRLGSPEDPENGNLGIRTIKAGRNWVTNLDRK
jgi:hypothetical protein